MDSQRNFFHHGGLCSGLPRSIVQNGSKHQNTQGTPGFWVSVFRSPLEIYFRSWLNSTLKEEILWSRFVAATIYISIHFLGIQQQYPIRETHNSSNAPCATSVWPALLPLTTWPTLNPQSFNLSSASMLNYRMSMDASSVGRQEARGVRLRISRQMSVLMKREDIQQVGRKDSTCSKSSAAIQWLHAYVRTLICLSSTL